MPNEQLRTAVEALRARLQQELDAQLNSLAEHHERAIESARISAESEADGRWAIKLESANSEWATRLESELTAARAEADLRFTSEVGRLKAAAEQAAVEAAARTRVQVERAAAEAAARARAEAEQASAELATKLRAEAEQASAQLTARLRAEAEQAAALAAVRVREEADEEVETERQRGIALLDAERERSAADLAAERQRVGSLLDAERQRLESELQAERQRAEADRVAERQRFDAERQQLRSERHRIEAERQTLLLERDRLLAESQERAPAPAPIALVDHSPQIEELGQAVKRLEAALEIERQQSQRVNDELRQTREALHRAEASLEEERQAHASAVAAPVLTLVPDPEPRVSATGSQPQAAVDRLFAAMRAMDAAKSLTDILTILVQAAAEESARAAVFIGHGDHLQGHKAVGFPGEIGMQRVAATGPGLLAQAVERREAVLGSREPDLAPPAFAGRPNGRASIAVPIAIGGEPVAVLYADDGGREGTTAPGSWPDAVQILGSHAASCLGHLTATRAAQAMRLAGSSGIDAEGSAKRYARLLVSEIKLYNEAAVRVGRENHDLLDRLRPEIERARRLYEERVPAGTGPQDSYFYQELIHTLADGDAALLGEPA
jgi:hypothetical protein